mmetsp:Transcript_56829/g.164931  ORF Transcript_56829/g.164931 Transcript_56829/m.164931 type:complete len:205 (-) Transcript_56829:57-671(-)
MSVERTTTLQICDRAPVVLSQRRNSPTVTASRSIRTLSCPAYSASTPMRSRRSSSAGNCRLGHLVSVFASVRWKKPARTSRKRTTDSNTSLARNKQDSLNAMERSGTTCACRAANAEAANRATRGTCKADVSERMDIPTSPYFTQILTHVPETCGAIIARRTCTATMSKLRLSGMHRQRNNSGRVDIHLSGITKPEFTKSICAE